MQLEPLFPLSFLTGISSARKYLDIKPWVITAIAEEEQKPDKQLWRKEPSADFQYVERWRRIRLLHKHAKDYLLCEAVAN